ADRDGHQGDVVRGGEVLQHARLAVVAGAVVVEVEAGLEVVAAVPERRGLGAGAGEVDAVDAAPDVGLGGVRAVAAVDLLGGVVGVVVVGGGAEGVDVLLAGVGVAGPAARFAGDVRVADGGDPGRAHAGTVGVRGHGGGQG